MGGEHRWRQDAQHARERLGVRADHGVRLVQVLQDVAHPLQVLLAGFGERLAPGRAVQQARAQVVFEIGDQAGHHRRRHVQCPGRGGEAALVDHAQENTHRSQSVHEVGLQRFNGFIVAENEID